MLDCGRRARAIALIGLVGGMGWAAGAWSAVASASAEREVLAAEERFSARSAAIGAARAWREAFDEKDGHLFGPTGEPAIGARAIFEAMGGTEPATSTITWRNERVWVARSGDLATTWGHWVSMNKSGATRTGRYVTTWRKDPAGIWKALVDIGNSDAPPPPVQPAQPYETSPPTCSGYRDH